MNHRQNGSKALACGSPGKSGDRRCDSALDFSAGTGDALTFGLTDWIRDQMGINDVVNHCSGAYNAGQWAGTILPLLTGIAGGIEAAGAKAAGNEFSHFIPNRWGGPRTIWNGNYVTTAEHALSDPYRYQFMPRAWKEANPMPGHIEQMWNRIPNTWKGTAAGAGYGAAGHAASGGNCDCK